MYLSTDNVFPAPRANQAAALFTQSARDRKDDDVSDRNRRSVSRRDRPFHGSYYVFRDGTLQVRLFDRQSVGW